VDCEGSVVSVDDVADVTVLQKVPEMVPLKQFVRAGKRGHYLNFGVVVLDNVP
jgi:hypothetical protein